MKIKKYKFSRIRPNYPFLDINSSGEVWLQLVIIPFIVNRDNYPIIMGECCFGSEIIGVIPQ